MKDNSHRQNSKKAAKLSNFETVEHLGEPNHKKNNKALHLVNRNALHNITLVVGIIGFVTGYLVFIFGHKPNGVIFEIDNYPRMGLALFISALSGSLLLWGGLGKRLLTFGIVLIIGAGLCYLPWHYKDSYKELRWALKNSKIQETLPTIDEELKQAAEDRQIFLNEIRYNELLKLRSQNVNKITLGLLIRNLPESYLASTKQFIQETLGTTATVNSFKTQLDTFPHPSYFFTILSEKESPYLTHVLHFIDVNHKKNELFIDTTLRKTCYRPDYTFSESQIAKTRQYLFELTHLSRTRQEAALNFFTNSETLINAPEVIKTLSLLAQTRDHTFKEDCVKALSNWLKLVNQHPNIKENLSSYITASHHAILDVIKHQQSENLPPPSALVHFLIDHNASNSQEVIFKEWKNNVSEYERSLSLKPSVTKLLFTGKATHLNDQQLLSMSTILRKTGNPSQLEYLESALALTANKNVQNSLRRTIDVIKNRL